MGASAILSVKPFVLYNRKGSLSRWAPCNAGVLKRARQVVCLFTPFPPRVRGAKGMSDKRDNRIARYSTVTLFARFRGWSTSQPRRTAM